MQNNTLLIDGVELSTDFMLTSDQCAIIYDMLVREHDSLNALIVRSHNDGEFKFRTTFAMKLDHELRDLNDMIEKIQAQQEISNKIASKK